MKTWEELKQQGSNHYKTGEIEPIDLYRSAGTFRHFAIDSIIKYAYRNSNNEDPVNIKDMNKIIHFAELLIASCGLEDGMVK